jgi:hypothetical protein
MSLTRSKEKDPNKTFPTLAVKKVSQDFLGLFLLGCNTFHSESDVTDDHDHDPFSLLMSLSFFSEKYQQETPNE